MPLMQRNRDWSLARVLFPLPILAIRLDLFGDLKGRMK